MSKTTTKCEHWEVDNTDYHADRTCDSSSTLKLARQSMAAYQHQRQNSQPSQETDAMRFGTAFHAAVLQPDEYDSLVAVEPQDIEGEAVNRRLKKHREFLQKFAEDAAGKTVIKNTEQVTIDKMISKVRQCPAARRLFDVDGSDGIMTEHAVKFTWHEHPMKAMMDYVDTGSDMIVDVKTTRLSGDHHVFQKEIETREYYAQASVYCEAYKQMTGRTPKFYWLFVHTEEPHEVDVFECDSELLRYGDLLNEQTIAMIRTAEIMEDYSRASYRAAQKIKPSPYLTSRFEKSIGGF